MLSLIVCPGNESFISDNPEKLTDQNFGANEQHPLHSHMIQYGKSHSHGHAGSSRALHQQNLVRWPLFFLWFLKYFSHHFRWGTHGICLKLYHLMTKTVSCRKEACFGKKNEVYICLQGYINLTKVHSEPNLIIKQGDSSICIDLFQEKNIYVLQNIALLRMEIIFASSVFLCLMESVLPLIFCFCCFPVLINIFLPATLWLFRK